MTADPLSVACPLCNARRGESCTAPHRVLSGSGITLTLKIPPHTARQTIAERDIEEKTMTTDNDMSEYTRVLNSMRGEGHLNQAVRMELLGEIMLASVETVASEFDPGIAEEVRSLGMYLRTTQRRKAVPVTTTNEIKTAADGLLSIAAPAVHDEILDTAKTIINGDRRDDYGSARQSFETIATLWSVVLNHAVTAHDVALCMVQLKVARALVSPEKRDSYVDMCGYAALGGHLAAEDHQNEGNN